MKKIIALLLAVLFLLFSTGPAFARPNRYHHPHSYHHRHSGYHHRYSSGDLWLALGIGLLTGGLISYMVNVPASPGATKEYAYAPPPRLPAFERVMVTAMELNVRSGPGLHHVIAGQVAMGEVLDVLGNAPGWFYVRTPSGLFGWVMVKFTTPQGLSAG